MIGWLREKVPVEKEVQRWEIILLGVVGFLLLIVLAVTS